jgi:hypothetical protein
VDRFNIEPFWDDSFKQLDYAVEAFNNPNDIAQWMEQGYPGKFTGAMCDMRRPQPVWNAMFVKYFKRLGWQDIGTSYYRMSSGTILPVHQDTYKRYIELFDLKGREHTVHRAIVFLEDWASGHYLEIDNEPVTKWKAGDVVVWCYDTPHMAANMGLTPRYTLQITGHL